MTMKFEYLYCIYNKCKAAKDDGMLNKKGLRNILFIVRFYSYKVYICYHVSFESYADHERLTDCACSVTAHTLMLRLVQY